MDVENPIVNDKYWRDYESDENEYDWLERIEEEEEESRMDYFTWSRMQDGYHF